ncbi:MAG: hypothetical protein WC211_03620 [Dehalococcoidia bacterium]
MAAEQNIDLSITERYRLANLLPAEGNFVTMTIVKNTRNRLEISEAEAETLDLIKIPNGWSPKPGREDVLSETGPVALPERGVALLEEALRAAEKAGKLTIDDIRLYEMFVRLPEQAQREAALSDVGE